VIELLKSSTFRLALAYFGVFAASMVVVLGLIYWQTVVYADQQTDETIDAEITGLAEQYRQRGLTGLIEVIADRSDPARGGQMLYLLTDGQQHPLAGNLSRWPDAEVEPDGWMRFTLEPERSGNRPPHVAQATSFLLAGGYQLLVGRDLAERSQFTHRIVTALGWSAALTIMLGLVSGLVLSRRVLARIESINRASDRVMAGEFGRRIPVKGSGDEFDRLAQNLNAMLDRIERLMAGIRQVSDNIAHDLRTPLGRLRARLETALRDESGDPAHHRDALVDAIADADQLLATFAALLQIAEAEAGTIRTDMGPLDLAALVADLVDFYEPLAEEKAIALRAQLPQERLDVRGNRHLLGRALSNLVENAIKYTPESGHATVTLGRDGDLARICVADNGPGVPPEERERVFDRFVRLEQSRTSEGKGLGLSLARAVIGLHGGVIRLEDNAPGLRVVVELPLLAPAEPASRNAASPAARGPGLDMTMARQ
jgi:signal transduction histidine kinase